MEWCNPGRWVVVVAVQCSFISFWPEVASLWDSQWEVGWRRSHLRSISWYIELGCNEECHEGVRVHLWVVRPVGEKNMIDLDDDE